jgi:predicted transcriptional regulator
MSAKPSPSNAHPDTDSSLRRTLEVERGKWESWAKSEIRSIEGRRDHELRRLDRFATALAAADTSPPSPRRRRRGRGTGPTTAEAAEQRRESVLRLVVERGSVSFAEILDSLRMPEVSTRSALKRLVSAGLVIRTGTGRATRYEPAPGTEARAGGDAPSTRVVRTRKAIQASLLATIEERGWARPDELAQSVHVSRAEVERECKELIRAGEIRMDQRERRSIYVFKRAA